MNKYYLYAQICTLLLLFIFITSCTETPATVNNGNCSEMRSLVPSIARGSDTAVQVSRHLRGMLQDKKGNLWFGTNGDGVGRYDGRSFTYFTVKDGLFSNYVRDIFEDRSGHIWFNTSEGLCRYDGVSFTDFTEKKYVDGGSLDGKTVAVGSGTWFSSPGGVCHYDGKTFTSFTIHPESYHPEANNRDRPYEVYSILEDKEGNLWFGTDQRGVCRYDGKSLVYFTGKGLDAGTVRCIFQDKTGNIWFGINGGGVCRYDGTAFSNFSEEKGLSHNLNTASLEDTARKLDRVWSVTEDHAGRIWFATIDEGVWCYDRNKKDEKSLARFTKHDGLSSNAIWTVYTDKSGILWFGTDGGGLCRYDGKAFTVFLSKNAEQEC